MKKIWFIFIFIFLTGLFSGLFFSTGLSAENSSYLSALLISGMSNTSSGFMQSFFSIFISNFLLILFMFPAVITKYLCFLPPSLLWYKSFAVGFCCGLVYSSDVENAVTITLLKLLPQNLFFIPTFTILAVILFSISVNAQKNRPLHFNNKSLLYILIAASAFLTAGCVIESIFHLIAL